MKEEIKQEIIEAAYFLIKEEKLPVPKKIWLRTSLRGTRNRTAFCTHFCKDNIYKITVNTVGPR